MNYDEQLAELWIDWIADLTKLFTMIPSGEFQSIWMIELFIFINSYELWWAISGIMNLLNSWFD